jgi:hypothetical protein
MSSRLADKPRVGWPEVQAKNVLLKKRGFETSSAPSQAGNFEWHIRNFQIWMETVK